MAKEPDPRAEWSAFERGLEAQLRPAYVLRGNERWFRGRAVERVLERARSAQHEICRHDIKDGEFRIQSLIDDLTSSAMFAPARCVLVQEPEALLRKGAGGAESALAKALGAFATGGRGTLVLTADSLRADLAAVKQLVAAGGVLHTFRKLYERPAPWERDQDPRRTELVGWLVQRAKERKLALAPDRAVLLAHAHGNDLAALDDQLAALASGTASEAFGALASSAAGAPNDVADGLIGGDLPRAVLALQTLFRGGMRRERDGVRETDEGALVAILLGYLRPRVRSATAAAEAIEGGLAPDAAASEAGIAPYDRTLRGAVATRSAQEWRTMLDDLLDIERRSRRGVGVDANDFTLLALRWARRPAARRR